MDASTRLWTLSGASAGYDGTHERIPFDCRTLQTTPPGDVRFRRFRRRLLVLPELLRGHGVRLGHGKGDGHRRLEEEAVGPRAHHALEDVLRNVRNARNVLATRTTLAIWEHNQAHWHGLHVLICAGGGNAARIPARGYVGFPGGP